MTNTWPGTSFNGRTCSVKSGSATVFVTGSLAADLGTSDPGALGMGFYGPDERTYGIASVLSYDSGTDQTSFALSRSYLGTTIGSKVVTLTIASPTVITWTAHALVAGASVKFATTGALPTGLTAGTTYYVSTASLATDTFRIADTQAHALAGTNSINTSGSQSGVHTASTVPALDRFDILPFQGLSASAAYQLSLLVSGITTADGATNSQPTAKRLRRSGYNFMDFLTSDEQDQVDSGGSTIDLALKFVAAMGKVYDTGGGTLWLPPGVIAVSHAPYEWLAQKTINIVGAGPWATVFKKFSGTDPILDFSSDVSVLDVRSEWREFSINGVDKTADGLKLTNISTSVTSNVYIHDCLAAMPTFGAVNMEHYNIGLRSNVNGYVARKSADNIYCNQVSFYGGQIIGNTGLGADMRQGQGWAFHGVAFESNGTTADLGTGAVLVRDTADDEAGLSRASFYNCHFESNKGGRDILTENCTGLTLAARDCVSYYGAADILVEANTGFNIGSIKEAILDNFQAPGFNVAIAASTVRLTDFNIGGGTLTDGSGAKFYENVVYNSAGQSNQATITKLTGGYTGSGTVSAPTSGTAVTLFTPSTSGLYIVVATVEGSGAGNYSAVAHVGCEGTSAALLRADNGGFLTITVVSNVVKATQSSGGAQTIKWRYLRVSDV